MVTQGDKAERMPRTLCKDLGETLMPVPLPRWLGSWEGLCPHLQMVLLMAWHLGMVEYTTKKDC